MISCHKGRKQNGRDRRTLLLWTLGVVGSVAIAIDVVAGQSDTSSASGPKRHQSGQMDSETFLHFLMHTPESLCGGGNGSSASRSSGGDVSLRRNPRILRYCSSASVANRLIHQGLVNGYKICQAMFQNERWNCTFTHTFLDTGYPQAGFVWAITVSKAVEELVMACRRGEPGLACHCRFAEAGGPKRARKHKKLKQRQRPKRGAAVLEGGPAADQSEQLKMLSPETISQKYGSMNMPTCDDNIGLSSRRVREFFADTGAAAKGLLDLPSAVNFHNRRAGHIAVKQSQVKICHCLGISGSCTKQVCIRGLRRHSGRIEASMHALFQASKLVQAAPAGSPQQQQHQRRSRRRLVAWRDPGSAGRSRRVRKKFLVYSSEPPDFCAGRESRGYFGVQGRPCNISGSPGSSADSGAQPERGTCAHLCCGRYNFEAEYRVRQEWCNCRMLYNPIKVDCQLCERRLLQHRCRIYQPYPEP